MVKGKVFTEWLSVRRRLIDAERAFARDRHALEQGQTGDLESLSIRHSEIRALRALSHALVRRAFCGSAQDGPPRA